MSEAKQRGEVMDENEMEQLNRRVAEEVMGWKFRPATPDADWVAYHEDWWIAPPSMRTASSNMFKSLPSFFADASVDVKVLHHIREHWDDEAKMRFINHLCESMDARTNWCESVWNHAERLLAYNVGDYSRAALACVEAREGK